MTYSLFAVYISKSTGISRFLTTKAPLNVAVSIASLKDSEQKTEETYTPVF